MEIIGLDSSSESDLVAVINLYELVSHLLKKKTEVSILLTSGL